MQYKQDLLKVYTIGYYVLFLVSLHLYLDIQYQNLSFDIKLQKNTHGPGREQLTLLLLTLVTNTDTEMRKTQQNLIFDKVNAMPRVKKRHICPLLTPATCLTYYVFYNTAPTVICGDKTKKSFQAREQTEPQQPSTVITGG